jgi:hypothetical protein
MTQHTSGSPASAGPPAEPPTTVAREQVGAAGQRVAETASDQATQVTREARRQARDLFGQAREQATDQARTTQKHAAEGLRSLAGELHEMAEGGERHGPASDLAAEAADRLGDLAEWLGRREPGDLVEEVRRLARRRPGAFLFGAAAAGVLAGRLTRGTVDAKRDTGGSAGHDRQGEDAQAFGGTYAGVASESVAAPAPLPPPVTGPSVTGAPVTGAPVPGAPVPGAPNIGPPLTGPPPLSPVPAGPSAHRQEPGRSPLPGLDAPTRPDFPVQPGMHSPEPRSAPPGDQTVGEYVDDLNYRDEGRPGATR